MSDGSSIFKDLSQWLREATKPAALWDSLKTAVWVVPLTVMIWIYAAQQQPLNDQNETILVDISSGSPSRIVTLTRATDDIPTATLSGAKTNLDQVITKLNEPGDKRWVHIAVDPDLPPGLHDLNLSEEIARADIFKNAGIQVSNVQPAKIVVKIDELQTLDVTVTAAANPNLVDTPIFEPAKVKITAPKSAFEAAAKSGSLAFVQINTTGEVPGAHTMPVLPVLTPLTGDHVTISPPTVTATFNVTQSDRRFKIDSLPIRRSFSAGVPNDVTVDVDGGGTIPNVWVTGPPDEIARIEAKQSIPYASLLIDSDDVTRGSGSKTLVYNMIEPHVKVEDVNFKVSFTVHHISAGQ